MAVVSTAGIIVVTCLELCEDHVYSCTMYACVCIHVYTCLHMHVEPTYDPYASILGLEGSGYPDFGLEGS